MAEYCNRRTRCRLVRRGKCTQVQACKWETVANRGAPTSWRVLACVHTCRYVATSVVQSRAQRLLRLGFDAPVSKTRLALNTCFDALLELEVWLVRVFDNRGRGSHRSHCSAMVWCLY